MKKPLFLLTSAGLLAAPLSLPILSAHADDATTPRSKPVRFGEGYMRAFVDYVYLPSQYETSPALQVNVRTGNKTKLDFPFLFEGKPKERFSSTGPHVITPYFALNVKSPIIVSASLRSHRPVPGFLGFGFEMLDALQTSVAPVAQISGLTTYSTAAKSLVSSYATATTLTDSTFSFVSDDAQADQMVDDFSGDGQKCVFVFTKGNSSFAAKDETGKIWWITSNMIKDIRFVKQPQEKRIPVPFEYVVVPDETKPSDIRHLKPTGKEALVLVSLKEYTPYVNVGSTPMQANNFYSIPNVGHYFSDVDVLQRKYPDKAAFAGATTELIDKLASDLKVLVDAGDLSLLDSRKITRHFKLKVTNILNALPASPSKAQALNSLEALEANVGPVVTPPTPAP